MKRTLSAALVLPLLAACSASPPTITPGPAGESRAGPTQDVAAETLTVVVTNSELALGEERLAFRIFDAVGSELVGNSGYNVEIHVYRTQPEADKVLEVASGGALYFGLPVEDGGAWVAYSDFDSSGPWAIEVVASRPDGWVGRTRKEIQVAGRTVTPRVGDRVPEVLNPTLADGDITSLTSDPDPDADFFGMTIVEAAASGRPTVVHFGSYEHCGTPICPATLGTIKAAKATYGSRVNFIMVETRDLADPSQLSPTAKAWGLPSEPWTFLLDRRGRVANRIEGPLDQTELGLLLDRILGSG